MTTSKQDLKGKVVLITGGTRGIGMGIAQSMLSSGCKVAITGRTNAALHDALTALGGNSDTLIGLQADVRKMTEMQKAVADILAKWSRLDVVIANSGVGYFAPIDKMTSEQWHETIDTNLTGVFNTVQASIPALKHTMGYIITIASLAGANFFANGAAYNASKFGLVGFSQAIMLDLRPYHIKVTTIMPGSVTSNFNGHQPSEADHWKIQPEDLGQMVVDLLEMHPRTLPSKIEVRPSNPA